MRNSLVSVIITTKNEEKNIATCLDSIKKQTYKNIEIIVVDNNSSDKTKKIAEKYTRLIFDEGPERSAQRNYGVKKSKGECILILDADMKLSSSVIADCVSAIQNNNVGEIIIPEESYGKGFWSQVRKLERSFYVGNDHIEAARFFDKKKFLKVGGFDEKITGPEDWDMSQRMREKFGSARISSFIFHNEGNLSFFKSVGKKYYYSKKFKPYMEKTNKKISGSQTNLIHRYAIFLSKPEKLFKNPFLGTGVLFLKTAEFAAGAVGYLFGRSKR